MWTSVTCAVSDYYQHVKPMLVVTCTAFEVEECGTRCSLPVSKMWGLPDGH
jgi:hypothetical protein